MGRNSYVECNQCQKVIRSDHLRQHKRRHGNTGVQRRLQQLDEEVNEVRKNPKLAEVVSNQKINKINNDIPFKKSKQCWLQYTNFIAFVTDN